MQIYGDDRAPPRGDLVLNRPGFDEGGEIVGNFTRIWYRIGYVEEPNHHEM
jgi:hypothetical protein